MRFYDADPERGLVMVDGKSKTVLVADHNSPTLIFLAEHLGTDSDNFRVLTARSAVGAIAMARQYQPDLAIVAGSLVDTGAMVSLPDLIKDVSPRTRIIIASDSSGAAAGH
jgi:DNA-binding NarL/FixJ family response regulator